MDKVEEEQRFSDKRENFLGTARIYLEYLDFGNHEASEFLDQKNVTRLQKIFELEGCLRLDPEHHIPAMIKSDLLDHALDQIHISRGDLFTSTFPPELELPENFLISCLHGRHRIAAARRFLLASDRWWTVDLFSEGLVETLIKDIREDYGNSRNFCDGDIYRQLRSCQMDQDAVGEGRWFARLTEAKRKDFKQLQRRDELKHLAKALDDLLPYAGFWPDLRIGTFHRVLNLKCPEELRHYLLHIKAYWDHIIFADEALKPLIDYGAVRRLQMRNPWASRLDHDFIVESMERGSLLPLIKGPSLRARILERLEKIDCIIPTLYMFFEDTKWLEPCAKILRKLIPQSRKRKIKQSLFAHHHGRRKTKGVLYIQTSGNNHTIEEVSDHKLIKLGYRQLWLFAWRHFPELSAMLPRRDQGKVKPQAQALNEQCWYELATTADRLGFESGDVAKLMSQSPDHEMANSFLHRARPQIFLMMAEEDRRATVDDICQLIANIQRPQLRSADSSQHSFEAEVAIINRCGRPFEQSHRYTRSRFFLPDIQKPKERTVSRFTISRDIFVAFFGLESQQKPTIIHRRKTTKTPSPEPSQTQSEDQTAGNSSGVDKAAGVIAASETESSKPPPTSSPPQEADNANKRSKVNNGGFVQHAHLRSRNETTFSSELVVADEAQPVPNDVPPDLQRSKLYEDWQLCECGDVFLVDLPKADGKLFKKSCRLELPEELKSLAKTSVFAVLFSGKKFWRFIDVVHIFRYCKSHRLDGVIYHHPRFYPDNHGILQDTPLMYDAPLEATTKARLFGVEQKFKRKERLSP